MIKNTVQAFLTKAKEKYRALALIFLLSIGVMQTANAQTLPPIDRTSDCNSCVPNDWAIMKTYAVETTPDMYSGNGTYGLSQHTGVSGPSPQGGRYIHIQYNNINGAYREGAYSVISGLTIGNTYKIRLYAQGIENLDTDLNFMLSGGTLEFYKVNGYTREPIGSPIASFLFPASEAATDDWRHITVTFTANATTEYIGFLVSNVGAYYNTNSGYTGGSIIVDGGGPGSVTPCNAGTTAPPIN